MPDTYTSPWTYEQELADSGGVPAAAAAPPADDLVTIGQRQWLEGPAGPVPTGGRGIRLTGGRPFVPQPMVNVPAETQQPFTMLPPQAVRELFARVPAKEALRAFESAKKMEAVINFGEAVKSGMPVSEALMRYGTGIYKPSEIARMQNLAKPALEPEIRTVGGIRMARIGQNQWQVLSPSMLPQTGPLQLRPVVGPTGEEVPGLSAAGQRIVRTEQPGEKRSTQITALKTMIDQNQKEEDETSDPVRMEQLKMERQRLRNQLRDLTIRKTPAPAAATAGIPKVTTQKEYDALERNTVYIGKDGRKHRKP